MKNKKAQAAMEFLMTYGWAILVVLIAIGALVYFGALSPEKNISDRCILSAPLSCSKMGDYIAYSRSAPSNVEIIITNGAGSSINIINAILEESDDEPCTQVDPVSSVRSGERAAFKFLCNDLSDITPKGTKFQGRIKIEYTTQGSTYTQVSNGVIGIKTQ